MTTRNETHNGVTDYAIAGAYFELLSTVNPVDIKFFDASGNVICDEKQVQAGYWVDRRGNDANGKALTHFVRFEITTGANEAVKFSATDGSSGNRVSPSNVLTTVQPLGLAHTQAKVAVGAASGVLLAANAARRYLFVQNQDGGATMWIATAGAAAVADGTCVRLLPGEVYEPCVPPLGALNAIGSVAIANCQVIEA